MTIGLSPSGSPPLVDHFLVARLLAEALSKFDYDKRSARLHIERAFVVAQGEVASRPNKGLLADWQVTRVRRFVEECIATPLRITEAAARVNLSPSYFSRAFKASLGLPFSAFVTRYRITCAKQMLVMTEDPLAEIALACGFADQPHLTRLFRLTVGLPPGAWRRQQRCLGEVRELPTDEPR